MQKALSVSVIVNNYNYESYLSQAVDSALSQTYPDVEVIVVDDCSTDNSRQIIASYGERIISVFHQVNGKQGAAFNTGFAKSKGDIVLFLDADDYLYPNAVEHIVQAWKPDLAKVHYRLNVVDSEGESRGFSYPQGVLLENGDISQQVVSKGTYAGVPTSGNALSRRALQQVMPIPADFNTVSDDYLSVLIPLYGKVAAVEQPLAAYRIHTSNQWAMTKVTSDRFHRFIRHDMKRCKLLKRRGKALGYDVPQDLEIRFFGRVWSRLSSLRLDPKRHPVPGDRSLNLAIAGIKAVWRYSDHSWQKRLFFSLWFLWVGVMPAPLAKLAITWLFSPQSRPKVFTWVSTRLRSLMNIVNNPNLVVKNQ